MLSLQNAGAENWNVLGSAAAAKLIVVHTALLAAVQIRSSTNHARSTCDLSSRLVLIHGDDGQLLRDFYTPIAIKDYFVTMLILDFVTHFLNSLCLKLNNCAIALHVDYLVVSLLILCLLNRLMLVHYLTHYNLSQPLRCLDFSPPFHQNLLIWTTYLPLFLRNVILFFLN